MNNAFYTGVTGLRAYQSSLNTIGNNVANTNTIGFKPSRSDFADLISQKLYVNSEEEPLEGRGVKVISDSLIFRQGTPQATERSLDFAIVGDGMFAVDNNGVKEYTRNGSFALSLQGNNCSLVTEDGAFVLDSRGGKISFKIDKNTKQPDLTGLAEKIGVYAAEYPGGLIPLPNTRFLESDTSGTVAALNSGRKNQDLPYRLIQGSLERSAVEVADEMTSMITSQRAYQLSARVVQTADEVEEIVNNLRR